MKGMPRGGLKGCVAGPKPARRGGTIRVDPLCWYRAAGAARALCLSETTLRSLVRDGKIAPDGEKGPGGPPLFSGVILLRYIRRRRA